MSATRPGAARRGGLAARGSSAGPVRAAIAVGAAVGVAQAIDAQVAARIAYREIAGHRQDRPGSRLSAAQVSEQVCPGVHTGEVDRAIGVGQAIDAWRRGAIAVQPARAVGVAHAADAGSASRCRRRCRRRTRRRARQVETHWWRSDRRSASARSSRRRSTHSTQAPRRRIADAAAGAGGVRRCRRRSGRWRARSGALTRRSLVGVCRACAARCRTAASTAPPPPRRCFRRRRRRHFHRPVDGRRRRRRCHAHRVVGGASLPQPAIRASYASENQVPTARCARIRNCSPIPQKAQ